MTLVQKKEIINQITILLNKLIEDENTERTPTPSSNEVKLLEMLTIKECANLVDGLSEHTVRQLCSQDKIAHVRAGAERNGKILISKILLLRYLGICQPHRKKGSQLKSTQDNEIDENLYKDKLIWNKNKRSKLSYLCIILHNLY